MSNTMRLIYENPAQKHEESLPIGNGSLGAMIFGTVETERLALNQDSLWSGYYYDKNNPGAFAHLDSVRQKIFGGDYEGAKEEIRASMMGEHNESYLPLGELHLHFSHGTAVQNYRRELDISRAVAQVSYTAGENRVTRTYFASYPQKAIFIKIDGQQPVSFTVEFTSLLQNTVQAVADTLQIHGKCPEHVNPSYFPDLPPFEQGEKGQAFTAAARVLACDGTVAAQGQSLRITDACSTVLAFFAVEPMGEYAGYDDALLQHQKDYCPLFNRVELYLGPQSELPTDRRLAALKNGVKDPALYALYFQYGRYLLLASSRKGGQAANLQGIWSWQLQAPWSSNWTTNINTEMNYWPALSCNLEECLEPYDALVQRLCEEGKKTARIHYHCRGSVHHHNADYWNNTNPVGIPKGGTQGRDESPRWAMWPMGLAWLSQQLYFEYEYNKDLNKLRDFTLPILRENALFMLDWVVEHDGKLVTCPSTSPENAFITPKGNVCPDYFATAMDMEMIREVWGNYKKSCRALGLENDPVEKEIDEKLPRLFGFCIGSEGQLLEYHTEFEESEKGHRHISHLYGLFPSELFEGNEELTNACRCSLLRRLRFGGGHTGWSCAWIINMFAILGDAENAYKYLEILLKRSSYDNLWDAHPPFQIDGNFGGTAGIANMLVQDRGGKIKVLPALPKEFASGYVKGLRIKNSKQIDISWQDGKLQGYTIY